MGPNKFRIHIREFSKLKNEIAYHKVFVDHSAHFILQVWYIYTLKKIKEKSLASLMRKLHCFMKKKVKRAKIEIFVCKYSFVSFSLWFCYKSRGVLGLGDKTIVTKHSPLPSLWWGQMTRHAKCLPFALIQCGGKAFSFGTSCFDSHLPRIPICSSCGIVSFFASFLERTFTRQNNFCSNLILLL